jgi:hypothetical protein
MDFIVKLPISEGHDQGSQQITKHQIDLMI